jgi:hypothetical protein
MRPSHEAKVTTSANAANAVNPMVDRRARTGASSKTVGAHTTVSQPVNSVRELELHAANLAGVLAAAVHELIDRHLDQGRNLSSSPLEPCSGSWAPGGLYNE